MLSKLSARSVLSTAYRIRFSMLNFQFNGGLLINGGLLSAPSPMAGWMDKLLGIIGA